MSDLPSTLFEMQRDILYYDLSENPYLQKSTILSKDKELKTNTKKIIPAINEILKLLNTYTEGVQKVMDETQEKLSNVLNEISKMNNEINSLKDNSEETDKKIDILDKQYNDCAKKLSEVQLDVSTIMQVCKFINNKNNTEEIEMEFVSKLALNKGQNVKLSIKSNDIYDPERQFKIYAFDNGSKSYKYIGCTFKQVTSSTSVYNFTVYPLEIITNIETDEVTVSNHTDWPIIVYLFK